MSDGDHCSMCSGEYCDVHFLEECECDTADRHITTMHLHTRSATK